ncbi:E3 ubiquitin-protein ligase RNF181 [Pyrus ussuriensis x Pyrus communis]|uniref:E3 ubiquitin-protein ligase RNF181 n=1 Tax=Pyrus ussuriensis x Pyrus communis TaxID=2448454 RepID=A0A5N5GML7_9ROSA|nr:E3 ubiquitin-protein ligase RNF181 [Pyrus ussuriensis x Pyrus communis]
MENMHVFVIVGLCGVVNDILGIPNIEKSSIPIFFFLHADHLSQTTMSIRLPLNLPLLILNSSRSSIKQFTQPNHQISNSQILTHGTAPAAMNPGPNILRSPPHVGEDNSFPLGSSFQVFSIWVSSWVSWWSGCT